MRQPMFVGVYKVFFSLLALSSVILEVVTIVGRGRFVPSNFFSFFTIQSNIFAAAVLLISGLALFRRRPANGSLDSWRGAATLYMATTGIVFAVLLAGLDVELTAVPWDNIVLHYIMPIVLVLDWLIDPPTRRLAFQRAAWWLVYPVAYVVYSLVRGELVGWYPYPFLNPATNGYQGVAGVSVGISVLVGVLIFVIIRCGPSDQKRTIDKRKK